jgi:hypothetical protein
MAEATRIRKYKSREEMERALDEFITTGYRVIQQGENTTLVRKNEWGSILVIAILAVCTWIVLEIPTIVYVWYKHTHADTVLMKLEAPITESAVEIKPMV